MDSLPYLCCCWCARAPASPFVPLRPPLSQQKELASKQASLSHREKIVVMNEYLAKLPEHNDIPKISYTG